MVGDRDRGVLVDFPVDSGFDNGGVLHHYERRAYKKDSGSIAVILNQRKLNSRSIGWSSQRLRAYQLEFVSIQCIHALLCIRYKGSRNVV